MANKTITRDILTIDHGVICHQVNCMGVMGAGLVFATLAQQLINVLAIDITNLFLA